MKYILLLTDIGFIQSFVDHFKNIMSDIKPPTFTDYESVSPDSSIDSHLSNTTTTEKSFIIPSIKIDAHIKDIRIAIIESHENSEPQALTLKVCYYYYSCYY